MCSGMRRCLASQATVGYAVDRAVVTVTIDRAEIRNAVDSKTAAALAESFERFDADESLSVAVLTGGGRNCCAGFELKALAAGLAHPLSDTGERPAGPTRTIVTKPANCADNVTAFVVGLALAS